jgi:hypothetical protein
VSKKAKAEFPDIEVAMKGMLAEAKTFEERRQSIETAMKFEALKLKAKGKDFGKGFEEGADDDF